MYVWSLRMSKMYIWTLAIAVHCHAVNQIWPVLENGRPSPWFCMDLHSFPFGDFTLIFVREQCARVLESGQQESGPPQTLFPCRLSAARLTWRCSRTCRPCGIPFSWRTLTTWSAFPTQSASPGGPSKRTPWDFNIVQSSLLFMKSPSFSFIHLGTIQVNFYFGIMAGLVSSAGCTVFTHTTYCTG